MLRSPTPFPLVGSYGLYEHEGQLRLARIVARNQDGTAVISLPERLGAGGNLTAPVSEIRDGTPLTAAEEAESRELDSYCHPFVRRKKRARTPKQKAAVWRLAELGARRIHARVLAEKLERYERQQRAAA